MPKGVYPRKKGYKRYEWANVSGKYRREREDFVRLCKKCHCKMDKEKWGDTTKLIKEWDVQRS